MPRGIATQETVTYNEEVSKQRMLNLALGSYNRCRENTINYLLALRVAQTNTQRKRALAEAREARQLAELARTNAAKYGVTLPELPNF